MIYWSERQEDGNFIPKSELIAGELLAPAISSMEQLRIRQRTDGSVNHICMSAENPNSVGLSGVASPDPNYNWTKRRSIARRNDK